MAEIEPERTEDVVEESESSTPDDTITDTRASTPDEGISSQSKTDVPVDESQVSDLDSPASTPDEKIIAEEKSNSNGLLKNSEITEEDAVEKP